MKRRRTILLLILSSLLFCSCWDKVEIDERAFVFMLSVNKKEVPEEGSKGMKAFYEGEEGRLEALMAIPNPSKLQEAEKAFTLLDGSGENFPAVLRQVGRKINRLLYFQHLKLIVFGEEILKDQETMKEFLDYLDREPSMNREVKLAVVRGNIKDLSKITPKLDNLLATFIVGIFERGGTECCIVSTDLNQFFRTIIEDGSGVVPVIKVENEEVSIEDLALIKDYKLLTYMPKKYTRGYQILNNDLKMARKTFSYKDDFVTYIIRHSNLKYKLIDPENLKYKVEIELEGLIEDYSVEDRLFKEEDIKKLQKNLEESFKLELEEVMGYFQNEVGKDYVKVGDYTKKYKNKVYKKNEKNWDEAFKKATFEYDIRAYIRRVGVTK